jgi:hypothetical protein
MMKIATMGHAAPISAGLRPSQAGLIDFTGL